MDTGQGKREETIKEQTEELQELLGILKVNIDNLVERNPKPTEEAQGGKQRPDNVFDEIISTLRSCKGLSREATEKVQEGISRKVH